MDIQVVCVGKLKEKYLKQGVAEYQKRLSKYTKFKIDEVGDEATPDNLSDHEIEQILAKEADRILAKIGPGRKIIVLAIEGDLVSSEQLADRINQYATYGDSKLTLVIGGSLGLAEKLKAQADWSISFVRITLPHQLMRLVLTEQIYRAFRIINHHA